MKLFNKFHLKSIHILTDIKQHKHLIIIYFYIQKKQNVYTGTKLYFITFK